ncbi:hypothetical protein C8R47DRAFT_1288605 [Mycena vitilis]|nr:hypothetical protein C8R47DRAFT_1288605 [Mycena vitilis]
MHPSLHLRRLEKLPHKLKRIAASAAQSSAPDVVLLMQMHQKGVMTHSDLITLLPVFYAILDAARIPDEAVLEEIMAQGLHSENTASALMSLKLLACMSKPHPDTYRDIWARVWPWIQFAHVYLVHLPFRKSPSPESIYLTAMRVMNHMAREWDKKLILMTPGVRAVVARSWVLFLESDDSDGWDAVCGFLGLDTRHGPDTSWLGGYIEGAGGTPYDLGATIVQHMKYALDKTRGPLEKRALAIVAGGLSFWTSRNPTTHLPGVLYFPVLAADGLVSVLTEAVCTLSAVITVDPGMRMVVGKLLSLLGQFCKAGQLPLIEALRAGLLRAILSFPSSQKDTGELQVFLTDLIPRGLVYHSALVCMPKAMDEVRDHVNTRAFQESDLYQAWLTFREFVDERIRFLALFDDGRRIALKACDNLEAVSTFMTGAHSNDARDVLILIIVRESASPLTGTPVTDRKETLGRRDLAFIRELALADFLRNRSYIITQTVIALADNPTVPVCVKSDYSGGQHAWIEVIPALDWEDFDYRVPQSLNSRGGELVLHRITVANGPEPVSRKFHLRFADTQLSEGIKSLAESLPPPGDARQAAIEAGNALECAVS